MKPEDGSTLVEFVRTTLGCECPDEVLRNIECVPAFVLPETDARGTRIDVGGRLLIYVVAIDEASYTGSIVPAAIETGIFDRDRRGFNRFRLVIAARVPDEIEDSARRIFDTCHCPDARVHLHVVAATDVPEPARPPGLV